MNEVDAYERVREAYELVPINKPAEIGGGLPEPWIGGGRSTRTSANSISSGQTS